MAFTYGTITSATGGGGQTISAYQVRLGYELQSQDIENNTSSVKLQLEGRSTSGTYYTYGYNQTTTIDGTSLTAKSFDMRNTNVWQIFGTRTITVSHNADGTYSANKSGSFTTTATSSSSLKSGSASVNVVLPTIPRASSITVNDANIGSSTNIVINKASANFTTTLSYKASGQNSWTTIVTKTANQAYGWTVPTSFYALIPNSKTINCEFKAETYNDQTLIGETTTNAIFTATGDPIFESLTIHDIEQSTIDLTGNNTVLIKGYSDAMFEMELVAQNSAGIKKVTINNIIINYPTPYETTVIDMADINNVDTNIFNITVTDSRGYSTSVTRTLQMINYIPLTINATIRRNTSTDGKINISFNGNYFNDDFGVEGNTLQVVSNTLSVQYRYKESTSSTWNNWTSLSATIGQDTYSGSTQISGFDYNKQYDFEIKAEDQLVTRTITGVRISKGEPIYWWDENGFYVKGDLKKGNSNVATVSDIGNATITIQKNSTTIDSFTTNASSNKTINISVPTKTSDLRNDSNFIISDFMVAGNSNQQTISGNNTPQKYNLNTNICSSGSKLTFNSTNHSIDIGSGVSYVEVSAQVYMIDRGSNSTKNLTIRKNDVQVVRCVMPTNINNQTISIPSTIIPVQQNDKLTLYIQNSAGNSTFGDNSSSQQGINFLTVKVIK